MEKGEEEGGGGRVEEGEREGELIRGRDLQITAAYCNPVDAATDPKQNILIDNSGLISVELRSVEYHLNNVGFLTINWDS